MTNKIRKIMRRERKSQYWNYFIKNKKYWGHGVTIKRLEKIEEFIFNDAFFWQDILDRHNGENRSPEEMKSQDKEIYLHMIGNFAGMIYGVLIRKGIIKP